MTKQKSDNRFFQGNRNNDGTDIGSSIRINLKNRFGYSIWAIGLMTGLCNLVAVVLGFTYGWFAVLPSFRPEDRSFLLSWIFWAVVISYSFIPVLYYAAFQSVDRVIRAARRQEIIAGKQLENARRKTLNLPVNFTRLSTFTWLIVSLSFLPFHHYFLPGRSILPAIHVVLTNILVGSLAGTFVYYGSEWFCRTRMIPLLFPEGRLNQVKGVQPVSIQFKILILIANTCALPVSVLTVSAVLGTYNIGILLYLGITFLLIGILQGGVIAHSLTAPIHDVVDKMTRVRDGDLTAKAQVLSVDSVGELTEMFNDMVAGLQRGELIRESFGRYVSRDVMEKILRGDVDLKGEIREATVLFSDIRNFTAISEKLPPVDLLASLNSYLDIMVDAVVEHGGRVDKFIGDSVMAVFGVPMIQPDHSLRAVRAAVDMLRRVDRRNAGLKPGCEPWAIGIGVHTGEIIAGNIGSSKKMEYAVIGEVVNTASRIEQLNKRLSTRLLISEDTCKTVAPYIEAERFEPQQVRGKREPVTVYQVLRMK